MATKEIKQRIVLEGEKEYSKAIKDAQRNLKTLRSELKAETAELGNNATAQQKNEVKVKSLQQQIKEQEQIVKTYQAALKECTEQYGDNEEAIAKWEQKLNEARTALANSRNEMQQLSGDLGGVSSAMGTVTEQTAEGVTATKSFADALTNVGNGAEAVSGTIENIFSGMLETVRAAASEVWQLITETAAKANSWTDLANIWGTTPQEMQKWSLALQAIGKDYNQLNGVVTKIALGGKGKTITELLGISDVNYASEWEYSIAVLRKLREEAQSGKNITPIYEKIFGTKKATDAMDLINNWEGIEERLPMFDGDNGGFGLSTDELQTLNDAHVEINTIRTQWEALQGQVAGGLGTVTLDILTNVSGGLTALNDFFNAETQEERDQALEDFRLNLEEAFRKVADAIRVGVETLANVGKELSESDDPVVAAIGDLLTKITEAFQWMIDNKDKVKTALEVLFGTWLANKIGDVALKLAGVVASIDAIKSFSLLKGGAAAAAGAGAGGTAATAGGTSAATAFGTRAGRFLASTGAKVLGGTVTGLGVLFENAFKEQGNDDVVQNEAGDWVRADTGEKADALMNKGGVLLELNDKEQTWAQANVESSSPGLSLTPEQRAAAEAYWDAWRDFSIEGGNENESAFDTAFDALEEAFTGQEDVLQQLYDLMEHREGIENFDTWKDMDNLPDWWFTGAENRITGDDLQGFRTLPAQIQAAVQAGAASGVSGITVTMDGYSVGEIVAPYVSQRLARDVIS